jgi:DNA-directed RNA polymerase specialized sigma24 family protein
MSPISLLSMVLQGESVAEETVRNESSENQAFTRFVKEVEPRLSYALAAAYGPEVGAEATADALVWAWEHWDRVRTMKNQAGYLYRVGQSKARRYFRPQRLFPALPVGSVDPTLPVLLEGLSKNQRVATVLIHAYDYSEREVAELLGISRWSVRTHAERGLSRLRSALEVTADA